MNIEQFFWDWRYAILAVLALIIYSIFEWSRVKEIIQSGMLAAKKQAKDLILNSGQEQEDWVVCKVFALLPLPVRVVMSKETFRKLIRWLYGKAKDLIDDGVINNSITGGTQ